MTTDVVIPVYGQFDLTAQCIDCVLSQVGVGRVIVVDDASKEWDLVYYLLKMAEAGRIFLLRLPRNHGFVDASNYGMAHVKTEYGVIVNSDTSPVGLDALSTLVSTMHDRRHKVAGPKLLFMSGSKYGNRGTIQHAGIGFNPNGVPYHPFMHLHRDTKAANVVREVNAVTGAVFAVHMDTWHAIGGFDKMYIPGVYEDVDFCLKVGKALYVPHSEWLHRMHGSQEGGVNLFDNEGKHLSLLQRRWGIKCDEEIFYGV